MISTRLLAAALLFAPLFHGISCADEPAKQVQIVRNHKNVAALSDERLINEIVALLESCTVRLDQHSPSPQEWDDMLHSASFVHVTLSPARQLEVESGHYPGREKTLVSEILVTLPENTSPGVYAKTKNGLCVLTKYYPEAVNALLADPALNPSGTNSGSL